jgi:hypothetical protein
LSAGGLCHHHPLSGRSGRDGIGNPGEDARQAAAHVKKLLAPIAPNVEVRPLVVFIDPRTSVEIINPTVPVLVADAKSEHSIKNLLRGMPQDQRQPLTPAQVQAFEDATLKQ